MNLFQAVNGIKTGTLDAKSEVMKMIENMTPAQRRAAMGIIPKVESIAKSAGISTTGFNEELSAQLK